MKIGFNILKSFERRNTVTHDVLPFGNINEVIRATEYSSVRAIENADIFTAVNTIASDISSLPIKVTDSSFENNVELEYLLNTEPNSVLSGKSLIYILIVNAILNGNAYAQIERDKNGVPIGLHNISNDRVQSIKKKSNANHNTEIVYEIRQLGGKSETKKVQSQDIIHIKPFTTDGFTGKSPLIALKDDIETQRNSKKFFSNFFKNGTQSGGIIKVAGDLNSEDKEAVREAWQQANSGTDNSHKIIVLDEGTTYDPIKVDTEILKLINESKHNTVQVAKVLGMPLHKMKIETHSVSLEQANSDYVINTLNSYISAIESEFNRKLFADRALRQNNKIKFNTDAYKYSDSKTKVENIRAQVELGLMSINEGREMMNLPPIENGDRYIQSLNFMDSELISEYQLQRVSNVQKNVVDENQVSKEPLEGGEI